MRLRRFRSLACCLSIVSAIQIAAAADYPFAFRDVGDETALFPGIAGIRGHGVAWGDVDGNGWADLFVTTFHNQGSKAAQLFLNDKGKFRLDDQELLHTSGMGSGALLVDLTNTGRLDLYVSNCAHGKAGTGNFTAPSRLFRNDGGGKFSDISESSGTCPPNYEGRGLAALDYDGDGLLDLVTCEQYYSPNVKTGPALYRNKGQHRFENVSEKSGLPAGLGGLAVASADFNNDSWPDLFFTHGGGEHRLLLNDGNGRFPEAAGTRDVFRWANSKGEDTPAGVCLGDVNRDGLVDVVIGHHFKLPWITPIAIRLYLNRGIKDGTVAFEDITDAAGLQPLRMKAPHVEIQDFDNDGLPDIFVSIVKFTGEKPCPVIYKNLGVKDGLPRFREDAWAVNAFPDDEDRVNKRSGPLFEKLLREKSIIYMAAGPTCDFDRDGRLDMFLANWWIESRSLLLKNETRGGHWLDVRVEGSGKLNRMGLGSRLNVYPAGQAGKPSVLIGSRDITIGFGYCSGQEAIAHFGLGDLKSVDLEVILPHGQAKLVQKNVAADQRLTITAK